MKRDLVVLSKLQQGRPRSGWIKLFELTSENGRQTNVVCNRAFAWFSLLHNTWPIEIQERVLRLGTERIDYRKQNGKMTPNVIVSSLSICQWMKRHAGVYCHGRLITINQNPNVLQWVGNIIHHLVARNLKLLRQQKRLCSQCSGILKKCF